MRPNLKWGLIGLALVLVITGPALLPSRTFLPFDYLTQNYLPWAEDVERPQYKDHFNSDGAHEFYPNLLLHQQSLRAGEFPTWNPYNRGGDCYANNPVRLPYHPLKWLLLWLPAEQVFDIAAVFHFVLAYLAMFAYLAIARRHSPWIALCGALAWTFCTYFTVNFIHARFIAGIGIAPAILLFCENWWHRRSVGSVFALGATAGYLGLVSGPVGFALLLVILGAWYFERILSHDQSLKEKGISSAGIAVAGILALLIALPNVWAQLQGLALNTREFSYGDGDGGFAGLLMNVFGGYAALAATAVDPYFLGSRDSLDLLKPFGQTYAMTAFCGIVAVPLALVGLARRRVEWWLVLIFLAGIVALSPRAVAVLLNRGIILFTFPLILWGACGLQQLAQDREKIPRLVLLFAALIPLFGVVFGLAKAFAARVFSGKLEASLQAQIEKRLPGHLLERYAETKLESAGKLVDLFGLGDPRSLMTLLLLGFSAYLFFAIWTGRHPGKAVHRLASLWILSSVLFAHQNIFSIDQKEYPAPDLSDLGDGAPPASVSTRTWFADTDPLGRLVLRNNLKEAAHIRQLQGYGSLVPLNPSMLLRDLPLDHPLFEVCGVQTYVALRGLPGPPDGWKQRSTWGKFDVFERKTPVSRFSLSRKTLHKPGPNPFEAAQGDDRSPGERKHVFESGSISPAVHKPSFPYPPQEDDSIEIIEDKAKRIKLSVHAATHDAMLIVADTWYPGWKATVNGKSSEVYRVDGCMRGIFLEPGKSEIVMWFDHLPTRIGKYATFTGLAIILLGALVLRLRRPRLG